MTEISKKSIIVKNTGYLESVIDEELVMMRVEDGSYFEMNKIGKNIWQAFEEPTSVGNLCTKLTKIYNVEQEVCIDEVISFFSKLHEAGMVTIS